VIGENDSSQRGRRGRPAPGGADLAGDPRRGAHVHEFAFTAASVGRLALALHQAIRNYRIALPDDEMLLDELVTVRMRKNTLGMYRLDHGRRLN
jgi:hypothetical protein